MSEEKSRKPPASVGPAPTSVNLKGRDSFEEASREIEKVREESVEVETRRQAQAQKIDELVDKVIAMRAASDTPTAASATTKNPVVTVNLVAGAVLSLLGVAGVVLTSDQTTAVTQLVAAAFVLVPFAVNTVAAYTARSRTTWVPKK